MNVVPDSEVVLLTYRDVRERAQQIAIVTNSRFMPPWLPEPGRGEFANERRLSVEEINRIQQWVDEGAVEGDPSHLPPMPKWTDGWQLGEPDLVVERNDPARPEPAHRKQARRVGPFNGPDQLGAVKPPAPAHPQLSRAALP